MSSLLRRLLPLAILPLLVGAAPSSTAEADVRALLARQVDAWNAGDLEAFCVVYAEDAVFLSPSGVTRTRQAVLDRYRKRYPDAAARGKLAIDPLDVRVTEGGTAASVGARWKIERDGKEPASGLTLIVLVKTAAGWRIVQDASM